MKKKLLAILTGAAITVTCFSALAACGDGKSGNNSGNSNVEQSGNSGNSGNSNTEQSGNNNSGNSNTEQNGGIEKISEQQFKNALSVFTAEDYWQYEYEFTIPEEVQDDFNTQKGKAVFDGNNKIVHMESIAIPRSDTVASPTMEQYIVAEEKNLTAYSSSEMDMDGERVTIPWSISYSKSFDTAALAEKALRSFGNAVGAFIELPCKTEENGEDKFLSDLYDKLIFDQTDNSYSINAIYKKSDIDSLPNFSSENSSLSDKEDTLEVGFKFIFENGKIKKLTLYLNYSEIFPDVPNAPDALYDALYSDGITYNFSYDEIPVTLPEEAKSATKV